MLSSLGLRALAVAGYLAISVGAAATAQERVKVQVGPVRVDVPAVRTEPLRAARFTTHRATKVVGMVVKNSAGDELGKVEDLVLDERGAVRYAAVSFGGFLGFNEKLFAVPFSALKFKANPDSATSHVELNVTKESLEKAPGFAADQWPDFGDPKFSREIDDFYNRTSARRAPVERR
jgi:sporulation protein YlmC with PRC-barrel domain